MSEDHMVTLISHGDVESLVLALLVDQEYPIDQYTRRVVRHVKRTTPTGEVQLQCAELQADMIGADFEVVIPGTLAQPEFVALQDAFISSQSHDIVAWPQRRGEHPEDIARDLAMAEHLNLATQLATDTSNVSLFFPLLDLSAQQVLDVAFDLAAPFQAAWPCTQSGATPCGACQECLVWHAAAKDLGRTWPWGAEESPSGGAVLESSRRSG